MTDAQWAELFLELDLLDGPFWAPSFFTFPTFYENLSRAFGC